jgi:MYXO-CTERM domain-containing protein
VHQAELAADDATVTYADTTPGEHRFRVELIDGGNQRIVVTSHIYVTIVPVAGGCGCGTTGGDGSALLGAGVLGLLARRRRVSS